ncbi:MAG: response regulator [Bacteroidia bacterium]|nr:response regulator [Bacteroidia bacterium]
MTKTNNFLVLVIEDDLRLTSVLKTLFEIHDIQAVFAMNGEKSLEIINEMKFDIIICDIVLPDTDGFKILNLLKNKEETKNIPFVFFSAIANPNDIKRGLAMGAADYITKPFLSETLLNKIHSILNLNIKI